MPVCHLDQRALILVTGPDAEHLLQNVITPDLEKLTRGEARPGALLTPQGKILFDFLVSRAGDEALRLECRAELADDLVKRLMLYRMRAKADIAKSDQMVVAVSWRDDSGSSLTDSVLADRRFPDDVKVRRHYTDLPEQTGDETAWQSLRIQHGIAESGSDYAAGDAFPHDVLFELNGGVGLKKGCYVGQEVVSRMHHRGTARRRILIVSAETALPPAGTELTADGRAAGVLGTVVDRTALTIARIDRVKDAMDAGAPIKAGETNVALAIPEWADFTFPEGDGADR